MIMTCCAEQNNQIRPARGNSGASSSCATTPAGLFIEDETMKKICLHCKKEKNIKDFYKRGSNRIGHRSVCKKCHYLECIEDIRKNPKRRKNAQLRWYHSLKGKWDTYNRKAVFRNIIFDLEKDYFEQMLRMPCHYCGSVPMGIITMGIDRQNNSIGYTKDNCVPCCTMCNMMKRTYSSVVFLAHINKIFLYQNNEKEKNEYDTNLNR